MSSVLPVVYGVINSLSVLLASIFGYWAIFRTEMRSKRWFGSLMLGVAMWALFVATGLFVNTRSALVALTVLSIVVGLIVPLLWVIFAADYTYRSLRHNPVIYAFGSVYIVLVPTVLSTPIHGYYVSFALHHTPFVHVELISGPARMLGFAYTLGGMALGTYYLASLFERGHSNVSKPTAILAGSVLLGIVPFAASLLGLVPVPTYDHTPFGISVFILGVGYIVVRHNFYNLSPVAREIVLDEVSDAMIVCDTELRLVDFNSAATEIIPEVNAESIGAPLTHIDAELAELARHTDAREDQEHELTLSVGDEARHLLVTVSTMSSGAEPIGTVLVLRDVTERKEYERELEEQRDNLEILNRVLRHDVRNDLQVVTAYAGLLRETHETEDAKDYITTIAESAEHAVELTETTREIADVLLSESADTQRIDLKTTLETEVSEVRSSYPGSTITYGTSIPSVRITATEMLSSVFSNLLKNAIQHNDKDIAEVTVSADEQDDTVTVRIADNGPGIPDDHKESIFGKGKKGLESAGMGIGLYLVDTLLSSYNGDIWVEDNDPDGSVFVVELPTAE